MQNAYRRPWLGIGLVLLGGLLLLHQFRLFTIDWHDVFWLAVCVAGVTLIVRGFPRQGRGAFLGVCAAGVGGYELLKSYGYVWIPSYLVLPALMILAGVGILVVYFSNLHRWHLLVPSFLLFGLGALIFAAEQGYIDRWALIDFLHKWWPASLVLFGTAILLNELKQRRSGSN